MINPKSNVGTFGAPQPMAAPPAPQSASIPVGPDPMQRKLLQAMMAEQQRSLSQAKTPQEAIGRALPLYAAAYRDHQQRGEEKERMKALTQALSGSTDRDALVNTLIQSGDPQYMGMAIQERLKPPAAPQRTTVSPGQTVIDPATGEEVYRAAEKPLRGKERFIVRDDGSLWDVETHETVLGPVNQQGKPPYEFTKHGVGNKYTGELRPYAPGSAGADPDRVKLEQNLRKEYAALSKDYRSIQEGADRVKVGADLNNAVGDLSLIFGYMKLLDPGSVVREGEFANAENAQGVPDRVRNVWNKIMSGDRLNPQTRQEFVAAAKELAESQLERQSRVTEQFRGIANDAGLDPDRIIMDFGPRQDVQPPGGGDLPQGAVDMLRSDPTPERIQQFEEVFGPGSAQSVLGR